MKLGSACSGVGCIDLGLERGGFEPAWQIEIDPQCRAVLARHWPDVQRLEDLKDAAQLDLPRVDLIAGGTPCQDLSVAGKGAGLDGERSGVFFDFVRLADSQPWAWVLWENVAGAFSTNSGRDFAVVLEGFAGVGFEVPPDGWRNAGVAFGPLRWVVWWCADAQYFGVPQRRRRIYLVAGPRGRCGPEVLLEPESVLGYPAPREEAWSGAAALTAGRPGSGRRREDDENLVTGSLQTVGPGGGWRIGADEAAAGQVVVSRTLRGEGGGASEDGTGRGTPLVVDETQITHSENRSNPKPGDPAPSLAGTARQIAYGLQDSPDSQNGLGVSEERAYSLTGRDRHAVFQQHGSNVGSMGALRSGHNEAGGVPLAVADPLTASYGKHGGRPAGKNQGFSGPLDRGRPRRLTPRECERLQGLPDDWTALTVDGQEIKDGPRYRIVGNGAAVPHVEWIGRRLIAAMETAR